MNWHDFIKATDATAVYPEAGTGSVTELCYIALGLAGEVGEAVEIADHKELVKAELLDALWYVARGQQALKVHGFLLGNVRLRKNLDTVSFEAAPLLVANTTKKLLRDGMDRVKLVKLDELYQNSLDALFKMLAELERDPETEQQMLSRFGRQLGALVEKLNNRKERGVLHGSGDSR
jgi:hypothetical protein